MRERVSLSVTVGGVGFGLSVNTDKPLLSSSEVRMEWLSKAGFRELESEFSVAFSFSTTSVSDKTFKSPLLYVC